MGLIVLNEVNGLGDSGRALWDGVQDSRKVTKAHESLLLNACRIADRLDELAYAIADSSLTVENDRGDRVANPLLTEHRMQVSTLTQVLRTLGVTSLDEVSSGGLNVEDVLAKAREERQRRIAGGG